MEKMQSVFLILLVLLFASVQSFHFSAVGRRPIITPKVLGSAFAKNRQVLSSTPLQHEAFTEIPALSEKPVLEIESVEQFTKLVEGMKGAAMVDFFADWCGPCKMVAPQYLDLAKDLMPQVLLTKVNVDELPDIASKFDIEALPTFAVFYDGEFLAKQTGAKPKDGMLNFLKHTLEKHKGISM